MQQEINHAGRAHALLSASGASRWMKCTPSARIEEPYPEQTSVHAEEGTLAHEFGELELRKIMKLINIFEYKNKLKELRDNELYTDDMEEHVDVYVTKVIEQYNQFAESVLIIEERVDFTRYVPEGFGTCDALIAAFKIRKLFVTDLKYGKGVQVYAMNNSQLKLYGLGALNKFKTDDPLEPYPFDSVVLTIVQPRLNHIDSWEISVDDLLKWAEGELTEKAKIAFSGDGELVAGEHCRFCKAAARCKELSTFSIESAKADFALDPEIPNSAGLSDAEMVELYKAIPVISMWIGKVQEYMLHEALKGRKWQDLKLVEGRSNRKWTDPAKVQDRLIENLFEEEEIQIRKLAGIGVIEKLLGKAAFKQTLSDLIIIPAGKASLVFKDDPRPEMGINSALRDFADPIDPEI